MSSKRQHSEEYVKRIQELRDSGMTYAEIAKEMGGTPAKMRDVIAYYVGPTGNAYQDAMPKRLRAWPKNTDFQPDELTELSA